MEIANVHGKKICLNQVGNDRQLLTTAGNRPKDAPQRVLRQVETEAQALAISIQASTHKLDYIAARIGKSRGYVSRMQNGERPIPEKLVGPLCAATGSNLLLQFIELQAALNEFETERSQIKRLARLLEAA
ncbi:hypothetical protein FHW84_002512 [Dyella sp. SG562]|uniref:hypothetical protein n=1 Tax=Dyella sp. SG562 TaxID=2587017 RepID=UPI00142064DB|nr:hypothetical protein [Dyella sp. SG562]NII73939.1 hypothetical protein [Dyella sp. SG562]